MAVFNPGKATEHITNYEIYEIKSFGSLFFYTKKRQQLCIKIAVVFGADGGGRTHTVSLPRDFESRACVDNFVINKLSYQQYERRWKKMREIVLKKDVLSIIQSYRLEIRANEELSADNKRILDDYLFKLYHKIQVSKLR